MPYRKRSDLPEAVKGSLPKHALDIYIEAYNNAWEEYADPADRRGEDTREEVAHKVAWAAVKKKYEKKSGRWVAKEA